MKTRLFILLSVVVILAWQPVQAEVTVLQRGPHSRVIQTVRPESIPAAGPPSEPIASLS